MEPDRDADVDPGAYIGRMPERATEAIPGAVSKDDERVAAHGGQSSMTPGDPVATSHREGRPVTDDTVREAGHHR